jgi:hypothetical protein
MHDDVKLLTVLAIEKDSFSSETKKHVFLGWYSIADTLDLNTIAHNIAKENLAKLNSESLTYVDYKFSNDEYILVSSHHVDTPNGISIVKSHATYDAYKQAAQAIFIQNFTKDVSNYLSNLSAGIKFHDKCLPTAISMNYNSEYDDNNYYTDIESIDFVCNNNPTGNNYYTSNCHIEADWEEAETVNTVLKEYIRDNYNISELELYLSSNSISISLTEPLQEELKHISSIEESYSLNADNYNNGPYYQWDQSLKKYIFSLGGTN